MLGKSRHLLQRLERDECGAAERYEVCRFLGVWGIRSLEVVFAGTSRTDSWSVSIYCMYVCIQGLNSCIERLKAESGRDSPSIHG